MTQETTPYDVVRQCADLREKQEEAATRPMTIPEAIAQAQWVQRTPDGFLDPDKARKTIVALLSALEASPCYFKASMKGEEVFVLRQQDRAAPAAILLWADGAAARGCRTEKVASATAKARRWQDQDSAFTKWPD